MAVNFLVLSKTCMKIKPAIRIRCGILCNLLDDEYNTGRNKDDEIFQKFCKEMKELKQKVVSRSTYNNEKMRLRGVFLWLSTGKKPNHQLSNEIIEALTADGITSISKMKLSIKSLSEVESRIKTVAEKEDVRDEQPESESKQATDSIPDSTSNLSESEPISATEKFFRDAHALIDGIIAETDALRAKNEELIEKNQWLSDRVANDAKIIRKQQEQIYSLETQLESANDMKLDNTKKSLEEIAFSTPIAFEPLMTAIKIIKGTQTKRQKEHDEFVSKLPKEFNWKSESGVIQYDDHFIRNSIKLGEQNRILKALELLAKFGPEYNSLKTTKNEQEIPHSSDGCMTSRATDEIRFSWLKDGGVMIYNAYRKNNTTIKQSEK